MRAWPHAILFDLYETLISEFEPAGTPKPSLAARLGVEETARALKALEPPEDDPTC